MNKEKLTQKGYWNNVASELKKNPYIALVFAYELGKIVQLECDKLELSNLINFDELKHAYKGGAQLGNNFNLSKLNELMGSKIYDKETQARLRNYENSIKQFNELVEIFK